MLDLSPKKSLGQHFLSDKKYLNVIVDAGDVSADDTVLEIGPGAGALTKELLDRGARVCAIELDDRAIEVLAHKFSVEQGTGRLMIVHHDATLPLPQNARSFLGASFKIVANIPYYITGMLLRTFLGGELQPSLLVFLMQREVAERIIARDGKQSLASLSVWAYGHPRIIKHVPPGAFTPPPSVESSIIRVDSISRNAFRDKTHEENFFTIIKIAFGQKRKTVGSTLRMYPSVLEKLLAQGYSSRSRPEDISVDAWIFASA